MGANALNMQYRTSIMHIAVRVYEKTGRQFAYLCELPLAFSFRKWYTVSNMKNTEAFTMTDHKDIKKVVLAYSGGLDTSIIIPWLKENYNNCEVVAVSGDVGQGTELDGLEEKAIKTGASKLYVEDLTDEMVDEVIIPSMKMGAKYEQYLLGTAFARPIIAKRLVEIAK